MVFEIRKISNIGTSHPLVARLGAQTSELINWLDIDKAGHDAIGELYAITLQQRLLRCHEVRD